LWRTRLRRPDSRHHHRHARRRLTARRITHPAGLKTVQPVFCVWGLAPSPSPGAGLHASPDPRQRSSASGLQVRSRWPLRCRARSGKAERIVLVPGSGHSSRAFLLSTD
jgi:hypothetical protein